MPEEPSHIMASTIGAPKIVNYILNRPNTRAEVRGRPRDIANSLFYAWNGGLSDDHDVLVQQLNWRPTRDFILSKSLKDYIETHWKLATLEVEEGSVDHLEVIDSIYDLLYRWIGLCTLEGLDISDEHVEDGVFLIDFGDEIKEIDMSTSPRIVADHISNMKAVRSAEFERIRTECARRVFKRFVSKHRENVAQRLWRPGSTLHTKYILSCV